MRKTATHCRSFQILTNYIHSSGVPSDYQIVDVLGLDDELLAMLPQPVKAFILLFPITEKVWRILRLNCILTNSTLPSYLSLSHHPPSTRPIVQLRMRN